MKKYVYILQSKVDLSYYIGCTDDLEKRLSDHNQGLSKYTSKKMPWIIVYYEEYETWSQAKKREYFLKRQKNRSYYKHLIEEFNKQKQ